MGRGCLRSRSARPEVWLLCCKVLCHSTPSSWALPTLCEMSVSQAVTLLVAGLVLGMWCRVPRARVLLLAFREAGHSCPVCSVSPFYRLANRKGFASGSKKAPGSPPVGPRKVGTAKLLCACSPARPPCSRHSRSAHQRVPRSRPAHKEACDAAPGSPHTEPPPPPPTVLGPPPPRHLCSHGRDGSLKVPTRPHALE